MDNLGDTLVFPVLHESKYGTTGEVERILKADYNWFSDVSGCKTHYVSSGLREGVGVAKCSVKIVGEGMVEVRGTGAPVPSDVRFDMERLCQHWNTRLSVPGLCVDEGKLCYEPMVINMRDDHHGLDMVVGNVFDILRNALYVMCALQAHKMPYEFIDLYRLEKRGRWYD